MSLEEICVKEEDKCIKEEPGDIDHDLSTAGLDPEVRVKAESECATDITESKEYSEDIVRRDVLAGYTGHEVKNELDLASELLRQIENAHIALESLSETRIKQETNLEFSHCIKQIVQQACIVKLKRIPIDSFKKYQRYTLASLTFTPTENNKRTRKNCNKNTLRVAKKVYICDTCSKPFAKRDTIIKHLLNKVCNKSKKSYACEVCQKKFPYPSSLRNHKVTHSGEKRKKSYACEVCQKKFPYPSSLRNHMVTHSGEKLFKCELCGTKCATKKSLKQHVLNHMDDRPFSCDICHRKFICERYLTNHKLSHSDEKSFECEVCGKRMKYKNSLDDHLQTHGIYSSTSKKLVSCDFCESKFSRKSHLAIHERSHTGEKPFPCEVCTKSFTSNSVLTSHMRIHTGEKPYPCDMCSMRFTTSGRLGFHKQKHSKAKYKT